MRDFAGHMKSSPLPSQELAAFSCCRRFAAQSWAASGSTGAAGENLAVLEQGDFLHAKHEVGNY